MSAAASQLQRRAGERPRQALQLLAEQSANAVASASFAAYLDTRDNLAHLRNRFCVPRKKDLPCVDPTLVDPDEECIYLNGNSLGLKPKAADEFMARSLESWATTACLSHEMGSLPAMYCDLPGRKATAKLLGAEADQVVLMNGTTVNLNLLLLSFYVPTPLRHKILIEADAFPSDRYAVQSQISLHGYNVKESLIELEPKKGEHTLRTEDILKTIKEQGDQIAVVMFSGVQFGTGQKFDMPAITRAGLAKGCVVGFDLAHAIGNVELHLDDWQVDFACWCSYKYLNSGAGGLGGAFVHKKHDRRRIAPKLDGWWGNKEETRFDMKEEIDLAPGAAGFRLSNPPPWLACLNLASLQIFEETSMEALTTKQFFLTGYLEYLLSEFLDEVKLKTGSSIGAIITPNDPEQRGNQLSLLFTVDFKPIHEALQQRGILCDCRRGSILRLAPTPLYNSFTDVFRTVNTFRDVFDTMHNEKKNVAA